MGKSLFFILIQPLVLLIEFIFTEMYRIFGNYGVAIIMVSVVVNILIFPLYKRSDAMQEQEREKQRQMERWVKHIRKTFRGDERFMMLSTYYRQQDYQPINAVRGSLSLLLQIPFFIAAYHYLSSVNIQGASFLFLQNLGEADHLLRIGGHAFHLMPILMTLINFVSGAIYTKGFPLKDKLQLYVLACVFLVVLYQSPSGLVLYWTMNNLFSLLKNIVMKLFTPVIRRMKAGRESRRNVAQGNAEMSGIAATGQHGAQGIEGGRMNTAAAGHQAAESVAVGRESAASEGRKTAESAVFSGKTLPTEGQKSPSFLQGWMRGALEWTGSAKTFWLSALLLTLLVGLVIPVSVVGASPSEFISLNAYRNPLILVWLSFCTAAGTFLVWGGILYSLCDKKYRKWVEFLFCLVAAAGLADYMIFGGMTGTVSPLFTYHEGLHFKIRTMAINALILLVILVFILLSQRFQKIWGTILLVLVISLAGLGGWNVVSAQRELSEMDYVKDIAQDDSALQVSPILTLSKTGKNVVVFMLDRAISDYFPYILAEKPELREKFSGFVYYPNTISFGQYTVYASAAIFGGYEYTPAAMNARDEEAAVDKQNEALKVLPVLFDGMGYDVTVCDPPLAGYREISDLSIYEDYPGIQGHITMGAYLGENEKLVRRLQDSQERDLFCYAVMKASPVVLQKFLYDNGTYFEALKNNTQSPAFMESYTVLTNLAGLTDIREESEGGFVMIDNEAPHEPCLLQMPDYVPADSVNNGAYEDMGRFTVDGRQMRMDNSYQLEHYHVNMASYLRIGEWLDYLKEMGVYDNTRIIIVADHGRTLGQFDDLKVSAELDLEGYHPILLVKDFGDGAFSVSDEFMTNADVPSIALQGILENPVNPFTGKVLDDSQKREGQLLITTADHFDQMPGNLLDTESGVWYEFIGRNLFDLSGWKRAE